MDRSEDTSVKSERYRSDHDGGSDNSHNRTLYISNLAFSTTETLEERFRMERGYRNARVRSLRGSDTFIGFVEFDSHENAVLCMQRAAGEILRGNAMGMHHPRNLGATTLV